MKSNILPMKLLSYTRFNNLTGFLVFCIAATVYCLTIEPTASFWDCGEFIVSAYKLEVGHPPGAPFFMLTANVFSQLTGDPALAARMINYMSALMSAASIWLLYLTITHFTRKLVMKNDCTDYPKSRILITLAAGVTGALAYTFSDTFWFSAVEAEVYAYSSLLTALVFWLILKWEDKADQPHADRWLILIAYLMGLSIGVHLLNLLCLPAIVLVYYYKHKPDAGIKGSILALFASAVLIVVILYGIVPGIIKVAGQFELLSVNHLGMPFNSGVFIYVFLLVSLMIWGVYESNKGQNNVRIRIPFFLTTAMLGIPFYGEGITAIVIGTVLLIVFGYYLFSRSVKERYRPQARVINTIMLCMLLFTAGFSCYAVIMVRSAANTPMDQNSPEDIFTLASYLNREQYGKHPLFYGPAFSSEPKVKEENGVWMYEYTTGSPVYARKEKDSADEKDSYIVVRHSSERVYAQNMLLPRMYSDKHTDSYRRWVNIKGKNITYPVAGELVTANVPTQWENLRFFFSYQLNFMYWRYFLWNFAGRQNDIQGHGEIEHGNWITGIPFIDNLLIGNQELMPSELKENKGRNVYYCLPLILGILGIIWQAKRGIQGKQSLFVVFVLFFMTGIAIIIYLNQTPLQARERDYAYAASFYAFAIWIGMGVAAIARLLSKRLKETTAAVASSILCLFVPLQMVSQTWDDHDRSGRYACRDTGRNFLKTTTEDTNPVIFTMPDNDTFPIWYNQEVEGYRTDARVCNLSYLQTDWYIDQMKRDAYDSPALPIPWKRSEYMEGQTEAVQVSPELKSHIDAFYKTDPERARKEFGDNPYELQNIMRYWIRSGNPNLSRIPTDTIMIRLDKEAILRSDIVIPDSLGGEIPEYMYIPLKGKQYLFKSELMMLEIVAGCNWERPVYISTLMASDEYSLLKDHICQEGILHRLTPFNTTVLGGQINSERAYDCMVNQYEWGGMDNPGVYMDETIRKIYMGIRRTFALLAETLIKEGKTEKAIKALDHCINVMPHYNLPYDYASGSTRIAACYYELGEKAKADEILDIMANNSVEYITWYLSMNNSKWYVAGSQCMYHLYLLNEEVKLMETHASPLLEFYGHKFEELYNLTAARSK